MREIGIDGLQELVEVLEVKFSLSIITHTTKQLLQIDILRFDIVSQLPH